MHAAHVPDATLLLDGGEPVAGPATATAAKRGMACWVRGVHRLPMHSTGGGGVVVLAEGGSAGVVTTHGPGRKFGYRRRLGDQGQRLHVHDLDRPCAVGPLGQVAHRDVARVGELIVVFVRLRGAHPACGCDGQGSFDVNAALGVVVVVGIVPGFLLATAEAAPA